MDRFLQTLWCFSERTKAKIKHCTVEDLQILDLLRTNTNTFGIQRSGRPDKIRWPLKWMLAQNRCLHDRKKGLLSNPACSCCMRKRASAQNRDSSKCGPWPPASPRCSLWSQPSRSCSAFSGGEIFRSRSLNAYNINTQKWLLLEDVRHTCLVNSMESSSTRFMKGSKPQRVPSTWKVFQHQTLLWNYSITHPPQPIIWHHHHTHALLQNIPSPHLTATVDPEVNPLVHKLLQLRRVGLRHLSWIEREIWKSSRIIGIFILQ